MQYACKSFLSEADGITDPGRVYAWIRTAAHRSLNREANHQVRELAVDPIAGGLNEKVSDDSTPEEALIARENEGDMRLWFTKSPQRSPSVVAEFTRFTALVKRLEIASRLGLTRRTVKRDLLEIVDEARAVIARKEGGVGFRIPPYSDPPLRECLTALAEGAASLQDLVARLDPDEDVVLDRYTVLVLLGLVERAT